MKKDHPELEDYLDEVSAHLGRRRGKRDLILELRSAVLDRAEEIADGEPGPEAVREALAGMGPASEVGLAYTGEKYLVGPRYYRAFVMYTGIVFVIHLVMIIVASVAQVDIEFFPLVFVKLPTAHTFLNLIAMAIQALLMDLGLLLVIFTGVARIRRSVRLPRIVFRVQAEFRPAMGRVILTGLVLILLNLFRDQLFVIVVEDRTEPLFTDSFVAVLPWLNAYLACVIVKELAYARFGERRAIVGGDAALAALGTGLMIWFLTRSAFLSLPAHVNDASELLPTLNQLVHKVVQLLLIAFAAAFALEAVKRFFRLFQLWR